jgi:hypothetical protein
MKVSLRERIVIRLMGRVYREHRTLEGWSRSLPFYLARCPEHGFYEDYPHGFKGYMSCPECPD